jgi:acetyl esterase/lipase
MLINHRSTASMWMRKALTCAMVLLLMSGSSVSSQQSPVQAPSSTETTPYLAAHPEAAVMVAEPQTFPLWKNGAPGALGSAESDQPTLTYYAPVHETGTAIVIAPGGGYSFVAVNHEGRQIANWLNALGIAAFVLQYRVGPRYHHPIELGDAQRAVRLVRSRAAEFRVQPNRVGIMGFSAGGHLASTLATHFDGGNPAAPDPIDRVGCRPDFAILGYAVISFMPPYAHPGSVTSLLGENPDPKDLKELSNELQVTPRTPPTFLFSTGEDKAVPSENSVAFYLALRKAGVPAELHIFEKGPHGVGLAFGNPSLSVWPTLLANWLREQGLLAK